MYNRPDLLPFDPDLRPETPDFDAFFDMEEAAPCPCCGAEYPMQPHEGDVCAVCGWEIDADAEQDETAPSEANHGLSLQEARLNFQTFGIIDPSALWEES